ncbi:MAG: choice-of-anchor D domain-containing protein, partial [Terracidiphilus sp.]
MGRSQAGGFRARRRVPIGRRALWYAFLLLAACFLPSTGFAQVTPLTSLATLTSPVPGKALPGSSVTFEWAAGRNVSAYWLRLGTTGSGSENLYSSGSLKGTSVTVTGLPLKGSTVYATLYSNVGGTWQPVDAKYTEPAVSLLSSPSPDSVLPGSSVKFTWSAGQGVAAYWLRLGTTGAGSENLYSSGSINGTSVTVSGLPLKGATVYATLYSSINGVWEPVGYRYDEPLHATLTSPAAGSVLPGSSATFKWTTGRGATSYRLYLGTTGEGSDNLFKSAALKSTSVTVTGLPMNGAAVYATLYSDIDGVWAPVSSEYKEPLAAKLTSPAAGSILSGSAATFKWTKGDGATGYRLYLGTTGAGSDNLYKSGAMKSTSVAVGGLPKNGVKIYATLYSEIDGAWQDAHYTFTEAGKPVLAALTSPPPGSVLTGSSVTFKWTAGGGPAAYRLYLGTTANSSNLYDSGSITGTSVTVNSVPDDGTTVYATLSSEIDGGWQSSGYTFTAPGLKAISCSSTSMTGSGTDSCAVTLSAPAGKNGASVQIASSNAAVKVPASVTVPAGATSASFTATVAAVGTPAAVTLTAREGNLSDSFVLQLDAATQGLRLSASVLSFGNVNVDTVSSQSLTLAAIGTVALKINSATVAGAGFSVSGVTFPITLNPAQTATLQVRFDPMAAGAATGTLTISSNAASAGTATVSLSGTGMPTPTAVSCASSSLTGAGSDSCTVSLNVAAASGGSTVNLSSNNSAVTVPSSVTVAAGATSAGFTATVATVSTAQTVTLTATESGVSKTFALSLGAGTSSLSVSASSVPFGNENVNTASSHSLTLTAGGTVALKINSATVSGAGFSVSGVTFPITLNPTQTATLQVQFDPTAAGAATGTLTISSNAASAGTATVDLSGTGIPTPSAVSCTNSSMTAAGTDACTVTLNAAAASGGETVSLSSNNSAVKVPASVTVSAGATSEGFTATVSAVSTATTVTLTATDSGVSKSFVLALGASNPVLTVSASSIAFGNDNVNTALSQSVTLTSSGTEALKINSATVAGAGFSVSGVTFPITLNPNATATLQVKFDPTAAGAATGTLSIASTSSTGGTSTVALSGTGMPTPSAVSCTNSSMTGAGSDSCTVSLNVVAATGGATVNLASNNSAVTVPSSVTVAAGATSAGFTATVSAVSSAATVTLTATESGVSKTFALSLGAATSSLSVSASSVPFGNVNVNTATSQPVT